MAAAVRWRPLSCTTKTIDTMVASASTPDRIQSRLDQSDDRERLVSSFSENIAPNIHAETPECHCFRAFLI
jgi:hypothetical protein